MRRNFPRSVGQKKIPGKFPPNFPLNVPNFPAKNQKKSPTSFCRSAGRRIPTFRILVEFRYPLIRYPLDSPQIPGTSGTHTSGYYGAQHDYTHTHFYFYDLGIEFPVAQDICYTRFSGRMFLCNAGASITVLTYCLRTCQLHTLIVWEMIFRLHTSVTQENSFRIICVIISGLMVSLTSPWHVRDKNLMQGAFFCCFRQGMAGMSRDFGRDVQGQEKLYARKLGPQFGTYLLLSDDL